MISNTPSQIQNQLQQGLTQFGLNPGEWTLVAVSRTLFQIIHLHDEHFQFLGRCNGRGQWVKVELFSL
ncbi:MAG: hypothetical protein KF681_17320 [Bdellovibrionaceae bacterium]|nr:hypothetical protein [Pseudobdellovibrionaceae bacterium]